MLRGARQLSPRSRPGAAFRQLAYTSPAWLSFVVQQLGPIWKRGNLPVVALKPAAWRTTYSIKAPSQPDEISHGSGGPKQAVVGDLASDLRKVKTIFVLSSVPRESLYLGLAGTLPYTATALSTAYLSWNINTVWTSSDLTNSFLFSHETATAMLDLLGNVQMHYGAVIISFLGAIHWGIEYAETAPQRSRSRTKFRYGVGVAASLAAWPTLLLPIEMALTTQFLAMVGLYMADWRATGLGWTPAWYGRYRFLLTAIVGASIFMTLVARAKAGDSAARLTTDDLRYTMDRRTVVQAHTEVRGRDFKKEEQDERERLKWQKERAEEAARKEENEGKSGYKDADDQKPKENTDGNKDGDDARGEGDKGREASSPKGGEKTGKDDKGGESSSLKKDEQNPN